uniref:Uncharacterized protein n=1 Tax=Quercus lobata TaxID=97700 RepID=A0A7N2LG33_QUELO
MENAMDGKQLLIKSHVDVLAVQGINYNLPLMAKLQSQLRFSKYLTKHAGYKPSWHSGFQPFGLYNELRLERDPPEGPIPHLEACLCVLLSIVPLAIANVLEDEAKFSQATATGYFDLLYPPASVVDAANSAARKAASFISSGKNERNIVGGGSHADTSIRAGANMRHLIVEACVARNLVDTSAYFWPGYVSASIISLSDSLLVEISPWSTFMEGAPLNASLINSPIKTPASSLEEIEKLYYIALNGSEEEKSAAAKILCGASVSRGWNIQEHVVHFVVKLLSPPVPPSYTGPGSHLIDYMSLLSALLFGASAINTVHILSLHENKLQQKSQINLQNRKKKSHHKKISGFQLLISFSKQFAPGSSSKVLITFADSRIRVVDGIDLVHKFKENYQNSLCNEVCSYEHVIFLSVDSYTM